MTVTSHTTSYQLLRLYLAGQLSPDDCPAAIEICKNKLDFLDTCIDRAHKDKAWGISGAGAAPRDEDLEIWLDYKQRFENMLEHLMQLSETQQAPI